MTGCTKITAGCDHCYAAVVAERKTREVYLRQLPVKDTPANRADPFAPRFWPERLGQPLKWREAKRVFVNSMSDVFHAHFSLEQIQQVFQVMNVATQHQFQVLTKRPERALRVAEELVDRQHLDGHLDRGYARGEAGRRAAEDSGGGQVHQRGTAP